MAEGPAPRPYDWWLTEDQAAFLDRAGGFLRSEPALHTVQLTVTATLQERGPGAYGAGTPHFGACLGATGAVCGAFVRTPPHTLLLTPLPRQAGSAADDSVQVAFAPHRSPAGGSSAPGVPPDRSSAEGAVPDGPVDVHAVSVLGALGHWTRWPSVSRRTPRTCPG